MSTGIYGVAERRHLAVAADSLQAQTPRYWKTGGIIADALRQEMPDLDDVTIGRVAYAVSVQMASAVTAAAILGTQDQMPTILTAVLASAGLQMTRTEWSEA